jgi:hypothetical protein
VKLTFTLTDAARVSLCCGWDVTRAWGCYCVCTTVLSFRWEENKRRVDESLFTTYLPIITFGAVFGFLYPFFFGLAGGIFDRAYVRAWSVGRSGSGIGKVWTWRL